MNKETNSGSASPNAFFEHPILNSPYERPPRHWELDESGQPTQKIVKQRRSAKFITPIPKPKKRKAPVQPGFVFDEGMGLSTKKQAYDPTSIINEVRGYVDVWRSLRNPNQWQVTPETARLLEHWRHHKFSDVRPFFCQVEAAETAIWLTEVAAFSKNGQRVLDHLASANRDANPELMRLALKLATGAGKTTVMAMIIAWQTVNAVRHPTSKQFTRGFLVCAPGLTIKDRLRVLQPNDPDSYYVSRELVPGDMFEEVKRAKIVITNYHAFKLRERIDLSKGGGLSRDWGYGAGSDTTVFVFLTGGSCMGWILRLVETGPDITADGVDLIEIDRPTGLAEIANLGLTLSEAKQVLARMQRALVAAQAHDHAVQRPGCSSCNGICHIKDWRPHQIATLFGGVTVRLPRWLCTGCRRIETGMSWPSHCRSTPELDQLQAHLSALMSYRVAAGVLGHLLPVEASTSPETFRHHTLKIGEQLRDAALAKPATAEPAVSISLDSTFIRSRHDGERHLEVRVGNVETPCGGRQVFGAVAKSDTDITTLISRNLEAVGRTDDSDLTAFTDGCSGLRSILAAAGVKKPPVLDWFHIAMRLQHAKLAASSLSTDEPGRMQAKAFIIEQVERLRWRIWNGNAKNAQITIERIRKVMHVFRGESSHRTTGAPARKLWHALHEVDKYLIGQSGWLVNYAKRRRASLRVGTSITEGTANFLVNRRMNKSQQMRWSRRGADLLLQVRCAVYNGMFGAGLGRVFNPISPPCPQLAKAA